MKRGLVIGLSILGGLLVLLLLAPLLIPASAFKPAIEKAVADATGREFKINDGLRLTYWPVIGVEAKGVTLANAPGGAAPYFVQAKSVAIGVAVAPLLGGDVQVKKLVATEPQIALEANVAGKPNWVFEPKAPSTGENKKKGPSAVKSFGLGDVRIVDGSLSFADGKGPVRQFSDIDMKVGLASLDQPLTVNGALTMNKERIQAALSAAKPRAFTDKSSTPLTLDIKSAVLNASLNGAMNAGDGAITGALKANGPSLRKLASWAGSPMGAGPGMGAFGVDGQLAMQGKEIALSTAAIKLDSVTGNGDLKINTSTKVPYVSGALAFQALDLNVYMPAPATGGTQGVTVAKGWPTKPLDLAGLKSINADLLLNTKTLLFQRYKIDATKLKLHLAGGVLNANLADLQMYGGKGSGTVLLDASRPGRLSIAPKLSIQGMQANPFLIDAIGLDKIEGAGTLLLDLRGSGANTEALMKSLSGTAAFNFADGAVRGVNLAQIARTVQNVLSGQSVGETAKTDFAEMAATFAVQDGVATTTDFRLLNPFLRVVGKGGIDIGQQTFNFRIDPKAVQSGEGQGGLYDMGGVGVPFVMKGPWSKPTFSPDLGDIIMNEATKQLDKLFGKKEPSEPGADAGEGVSADDPLGGFLKGLGGR